MLWTSKKYQNRKKEESDEKRKKATYEEINERKKTAKVRKDRKQAIRRVSEQATAENWKQKKLHQKEQSMKWRKQWESVLGKENLKTEIC